MSSTLYRINKGPKLDTVGRPTDRGTSRSSISDSLSAVGGVGLGEAGSGIWRGCVMCNGLNNISSGDSIFITLGDGYLIILTFPAHQRREGHNR